MRYTVTVGGLELRLKNMVGFNGIPKLMGAAIVQVPIEITPRQQDVPQLVLAREIRDGSQ